MKQFRFRALTCLTLAATAATANADLIISEVVDGTLPGGTPKFVELTNTGAADIDLSNYSFGNMNNGGTNLGGGSSAQLAGILAPGASYVIGYDGDNDPFNSVYGFDADFLMGGGFVNGDDTLILFQGIGTGDGTDATIVDIFGVIGTDGTGEDWEYTDSYAYRLGTSPNNGVLDTSDWFIAGANALEAGCGGDDACETINLQTLTTPGTHGAPSAGPDECSGATAISGDGVYAFDATSATTGAEGQNEALCYNFGSSAIENDVWFEWTCAADGTVTVSTCDDASADTRLAAYDGAGCPSDGSAIACNDDASGCAGFTSVISFAGTSGSVYMIQVGHFPGTAGGTGNITVTTTAPPTGPNPDNCDEATAIAGDGVYAFDATSATTGAEGQNEALCYSFGSSAVVNDVWFEWTSDTDGTVNVSTCGDASADTRIAAYAGAGCPSAGSAIACNDDAPGCAGFTSSMDFACTSGSVYMIQVGHFPGTPGGTGNITVTQTAAPTGPGTAYCFGDGSGTACPCGNAGSSDSGCSNSTGSGGSLAASGDASLSADTVVLEASGLVPNLPCLFFSGKNQVAGGNGIVFGDGLRCAGFEAVRLEVTVSNGSGDANTSVQIGNNLSVTETAHYQCWYRDNDASAPCGNSFNTTNAYTIVWGS